MIRRIVDDLRTKVTDQDNLIKTTVQNVTRDYLEKYKVTNDDGLDNGDRSPLTGYGSDNMQGADAGFDKTAQ